ncbi:MAG TPA: PH domain-containing protein [Acidimicrobiales bacterium]|nr:PH domain-containing protein [Acidimicrobiales bacterium]
MPYPEKLLHDDEEVIFDLRPHWVRLTRPVTVAVVAFAGVGVGFFVWRSAPAWFGAFLGVIALVAASYLFGKVLAWRATLLVLTSSRVVYRSGVLRRIGREIPIDRVQDVTYVQRLRERIVGAGTVIVESAGEHGAEPFPDIRRPEIVQRAINRAIDQSRRDSRMPPGTWLSEVPERIEQLADLHRRGVLTDAEFEEKRREMLDQM